MEPHNKPGRAKAEQGEVIQDGPGATAVSMTPRAASKTGVRLIKAAAKAKALGLNRAVDG